MAIKWKDHFISTSGATGTYADPYGWNENGTWVDGDVCRVKARTISSILESGTDTVKITNGNQRNQLTVVGTQNLTYSLYDVLYFPDYGTFWKINSSVSGGVLTGASNNYIPVPVRATQYVSGTDYEFTVQKVDMTIFSGPSNSSNILYIGAGSRNYYIPTTDGWTSETAQTTDGTAVSICNSQTTGNGTTYLNSGGATSEYASSSGLYPTGSTENYTELDCPNTIILATNNSSSTANLNTYGLPLKTLKLRQLWLGGSLSSSPYFCAPYENINIDITNLIMYNPLNFFRYTLKNDQLWNNDSSFTTDRITLTANFDYVYSYQNGPINGERGYYLNGRNNNANITVGELWTRFCPAKLFTISNCHNLTIDQGPVHHQSSSGGCQELYLAYDITGTVSITYTNFKVEDGNNNNNTTVNWHGTMEEGSSYSLTKPSGHEMALTSDFPLPTGFTATNSTLRPYAFNYQTTTRYLNISTQNLREASQPYVVKVPIARPTTLSSDYRFPTQNNDHATIYEFTDTPIMITPQAASLQTAYNRQARYFPYLVPDTGTVRTTGKSLKWQLDNYASSYHTQAPKGDPNRSHSMYPIYIPVLSGTSYTFTGYLRTNRSTMATGDAWFDIFNSDGAFISRTEFTSSAYNAWEAVSVTFSAAQDGFARCAFKAIWNGSNQNYWIDDVEVS
jgi:hypothetical protein